MNGTNDYWIKDIRLAVRGGVAVAETLKDMPGLIALEKKYAKKQPLKGLRITGCVLVTYETAAFIVLLKKLGADLRWCPDNRFASLDDACAYVASLGIPVFAKRGMTEKEYLWTFEQAVKFTDKKGKVIGPNFVIDDGCDITRYLHKRHPELYQQILATNEQTTCGVTFHYALQKKGQLKTIVFNINESVTKAKFDNIYGSRESLIEGLQNALNVQLGGKNVVIFGYGEVGKGCVKVMEGIGAHIGVVEIDPIMAMQCHMEGYTVLSKQEACKTGDLFITATGCNKTIDENDLRTMKSGAILINMGHGNMEIDTKYLYRDPKIKKQRVNDYSEKFTFPNKKDLYLLVGGYLLNLCSGEGHPPRVMSITFTNHILAIVEFLKNQNKYKKGEIYRVSRTVDEEVARLNFPELRNKITKLTKEQAEYLGVSVDGPFKREDYRY
ncbi:MAG: adenosylhomocysteinase [Candidatus Paceibacterota bacterium]|jgi:adenosylhomocysteinase